MSIGGISLPLRKLFFTLYLELQKLGLLNMLLVRWNLESLPVF